MNLRSGFFMENQYACNHKTKRLLTLMICSRNQYLTMQKISINRFSVQPSLLFKNLSVIISIDLGAVRHLSGKNTRLVSHCFYARAPTYCSLYHFNSKFSKPSSSTQVSSRMSESISNGRCQSIVVDVDINKLRDTLNLKLSPSYVRLQV